MNSFDGMYAMVTGSASGLGAATAVALARGGARVIINYRTSGRGDS
jgi:NAD(P)-dependent dehydrogenase (short-subunit alcohol dehydrogenase family)